MSSKGIVLLTGLNGYVAGRTAELILKAGYSVRGTVRNVAAGEKVRETLLELGYGQDVEVVEVPDITKAGAFDDAVAGCTAILHLASPLSGIWDTDPREVLRMAVDGTASILDSVLKKAGPQLQSVVYMSSAAALFDTPVKKKVYTEKDWNNSSEGLVEELGGDAGGFNAYCASKTMAERLFWKFRDEHKPAFAMTALLPTYIIGVPLVPWETKEQIPYSNSSFWKLVAGEDVPGPMMLYEATVDIRDVARVLWWSVLNREKADGERYICSSHVGGGQAIADVLSERMPSLNVQRGIPGRGYLPGYKNKPDTVAFDPSKVPEATGQDWIPYESSVVDLAQFLQRYLA